MAARVPCREPVRLQGVARWQGRQRTDTLSPVVEPRRTGHPW